MVFRGRCWGMVLGFRRSMVGGNILRINSLALIGNLKKIELDNILIKD